MAIFSYTLFCIFLFIMGYVIGKYKIIDTLFAVYQEWRKKKEEDIYGARY